MERRRYKYHQSHNLPKYSVRALDNPDLKITGETLLNSGLHSYETYYKVRTPRGDPDNESIGQVLARLENYQTRSALPPVCVTCKCQRGLNVQSPEFNGDSNDSDSDSDDEALLTIEHLLKVLERYMTRASSASQMKTMVRLINSHTVTEQITPQQIMQLQSLLRRTKPELREAGLLFIKQLSVREDNAIVMADNEIFNDLLTVLSSPHSVKVQVAALRAAEELFSHSSVADRLVEAVDEVLLPVLLRVLYSEHPMEMKYGSCCVLRTLSRHETTASLVGQELLFIVKELKESSSKMKEVFVEIVINLYRQTDVVYPDMIDKNIIKSTAAMIVDGPCGVQQQALHLVQCLVEDEEEAASVVKNQQLLLYVLQCMRDSHCRKVREVAGKIIQTVLGYRKMSFARTMMENFSAFLHPEDSDTYPESAPNSARIVYPVRVRHKVESRNWQSLEEFLQLVGKMITKEATIQVDPSTKEMIIDENPTSDWNASQLGCLSALVAIATNLCMWPLEKYKSNNKKLDLSELTDNENLRNMLKNVNRQLTSEVWTTCGKQISVLLSKFAEKVQIRCNPLSARPGSRQSSRTYSPLSARRSKTPREILSDSEIQLVKSLLNFFLFVSVASCTNKKKTRRIDFIPEKPERESVARMKEGLWVMANPHLTQSIDRYSTSEATELIERRQQELMEKEASADRRLLRKGLYEMDLFRIVSPFVSFENEEISDTSAMVLRCAIQPLEEKLVASNSHTAFGPSSGPVAAFKARLRPQSASTHREREKKLGIALHRMSPEVAGVIKAAVRKRPSSASSVDTLAQRNRLNLKPTKSQPVIDLSQPIAHQCRKVTVENCGDQLLKGLFSKSRDVRKSCLLLIHDLVNHGNVETHMQLSELGCIPRLIDFLRINEDDEMLEIIAVILARMLITSDHRLKQLFNRHGGANLLLFMSQNCSGVLKDEVKSTLNTLTQGVSQRPTRPMSAPALRHSEDKEPDIWDHIMDRWHYEDKVVRVFQKWM